MHHCSCDSASNPNSQNGAFLLPSACQAGQRTPPPQEPQRKQWALTTARPWWRGVSQQAGPAALPGLLGWALISDCPRSRSSGLLPAHRPGKQLRGVATLRGCSLLSTEQPRALSCTQHGAGKQKRALLARIKALVTDSLCVLPESHRPRGPVSLPLPMASASPPQLGNEEDGSRPSGRSGLEGREQWEQAGAWQRRSCRRPGSQSGRRKPGSSRGSWLSHQRLMAVMSAESRCRSQRGGHYNLPWLRRAESREGVERASPRQRTSEDTGMFFPSQGAQRQNGAEGGGQAGEPGAALLFGMTKVAL